MEGGNARPVQVPILLYWGGFPQPPIYQEEPLAYCSDDDIEDSDANDDEQKMKTHKKNQKNKKTHKKNTKLHKNLGSKSRTAAPKKMYKIPINPPKKINKKYQNPKKGENSDDNVNNDDEHSKNVKNPKKSKKYQNSKKSFSYTNVNNVNIVQAYPCHVQQRQ